MKTALVLGGGGFIGGHLARKLKNDGFWVRVVDIKNHEYFSNDEICHDYVAGDLRDPVVVSEIMKVPIIEMISSNSFDEVYQLAADMGGAGYIFTGENDANVMHNSALINLNVAYESSRKMLKEFFTVRLRVCILKEISLIRIIQIALKTLLILQLQTLSMVGKNYLAKDSFLHLIETIT